MSLSIIRIDDHCLKCITHVLTQLKSWTYLTILASFAFAVFMAIHFTQPTLLVDIARSAEDIVHIRSLKTIK